jgi:hypothetical protein
VASESQEAVERPTGYSLIRAGGPVTTLGTLNHRLGQRGFRLPSDNPSRVDLTRLPLDVYGLAEFNRKMDGFSAR